MRGIEWLNHNQYRSYPFVEDQVLQGASGGDTLDLPLDTLLDLTVLSYSGSVAEVRLISIDIHPAGASATFTFTISGGPVVIVVSAAITPPFEGEVRVDTSPGHAGLLLRPIFGAGIGEITGNAANYGKTFLFDLLMEHSTTIAASNSWVTSIVGIEPGGGETEFLGDVLLAEGYNIILSFNKSRNTIEIKAAVGAGLGVPCEPMLGPPADCEEGIYYINGRHPDWYGRFTLEATAGLKVTEDASANKIIFTSDIDPLRPQCNDPSGDP